MPLLTSRHQWPSSYRYRRLIERLRASFEHIIALFYRRYRSIADSPNRFSSDVI